MASEPTFVKKGDPVLASGWNSMVGSIKTLNLLNGVTRQRLQGGGRGVSEPCPFGETTTDKDGKLLLVGGFVFVGNKNHNIKNFDLRKDNKRNAFLFVKIPCKANLDDDSQILLPGIATDNGNPTIEENTTNVPDNESPKVDDEGNGILYVPVGQLILDTATQIMSYRPSGCGNITATHCAGSLGFTRV